MLDCDDTASDSSRTTVIIHNVDSDSDVPITPVDDHATRTSSGINLSISRHNELDTAFDDLARASKDDSFSTMKSFPKISDQSHRDGSVGNDSHQLDDLEKGPDYSLTSGDHPISQRSGATVKPFDITETTLDINEPTPQGDLNKDTSAALRQEIDGQIQEILNRSMASIAHREPAPELPMPAKLPIIDADAIIALVYRMNTPADSLPKTNLSSLPVPVVVAIVKRLHRKDRRAFFASCKYLRQLRGYFPVSVGRRHLRKLR